MTAPLEPFTDAQAERVRQAIYDVAVDHPMWIDCQGRALDYSPEREARIGDFVEAATTAVLAAVAPETDGLITAEAAGFDPDEVHRLRTSGSYTCTVCGRYASDRVHETAPAALASHTPGGEK